MPELSMLERIRLRAATAATGGVSALPPQRPVDISMVRSTKASPASLDNSQLVDSADVAALLRISLKTFRRMISAGKIPAPHLKFQRSSRWLAADIQLFVSCRGDIDEYRAAKSNQQQTSRAK